MATYTPEQVTKIIMHAPDRITAGMRVPKFGMGRLVSLRPSFFNSAGRVYRDATAQEELEHLHFSSSQIKSFAHLAMLTKMSVQMAIPLNTAFYADRLEADGIPPEQFAAVAMKVLGRELTEETLIGYLNSLQAENPGAFITDDGPNISPTPAPQTA